MLDELLKNADQLTFSVLFVAMLVYTMKTNDKREQRYQDTIEENSTMVKDSLKALRGYDEVKADVKEVKKILISRE